MADRRPPILFVIVVVLALLALVAWWLRRESPPPVTPTAEAPAAAPIVPAVGLPPAVADAAERSEVPVVPVVSTPAADPLLARVRGRCVDEAGAPLAGCTVALDAWGGNTNRMALQGKVNWQDPAPFVTGDDGRFDIAFAPPSGMQFALDIQGEGRVPRTGRWGQIQPAQVIELGDLRLQTGFLVRGRVVDEVGAPVARVSVTLQNLPLPIGASMAANNSRSGSSAANGEFAIRVPIPAGTWPLAVQARGVRLVGPDHAIVTERGAEPLLVTVRSMPSIGGFVTDEQGQPVPGVTVGAVLNRSGRMASGRSREDGAFTVFAVDADLRPVQLRIDDPGPCEPPAAPDERAWEWGSQDVRIEVRRALAGELVVVERATGAPVTEFAVSCYSARSNSSLQSDLRLSGDHPGGRVTIDRIWRGRNFLKVIPLDPALLPSATIEFEASDAVVPPLRVELDRLAPATVRVETADGVPLVGSKVEVIAKGTLPFDAAAHAENLRGGGRGHSSDPKFRFHQRLSEAVTGADGKATVFVPARADGLVVRATGEHPPAIVDPVRFQAGLDLVVVPAAAGSIAGVVRLQGFEPGSVYVVRHQGAPGAQPGSRDKCDVQADGTFAMRGLAAGHHRLQLMLRVQLQTDHGSSGGATLLGVPEVEVVVAGGRETKVEIDATAVVPATVRGRVLLDGAPATPARVYLQGAGAQFGQFVPRADGSFEASGLLPGRYGVVLVVGDFQAGQGDAILHDDAIVLASGQQLVADFVFVRRRLVITLLQPDGKTPAANLECQFRGEGVGIQTRSTDQNGRLVIDPAPAVPVHIRPGNRRTALGPVQVPVGQSSHEVTLTLPADGIR